MYSRRDFGKIALAGIPASALLGAAIDSSVNGVRLGASTYSFRDFPRTQGQDIVDPVIKALQFCRVGEIELYSPTIEPAGAALPPEPPAPYGMPRPPRVPRTEEQARSREVQPRSSPEVADHRSRRALSGHSEEVRNRRRARDRLHRQLQRYVHRRGDRRYLPTCEVAGRRGNRNFDHPHHGRTRRALRRPPQILCGAAWQFQRRRHQPFRVGGKFYQRDGAVPLLQGESGHRSFHRGQLRRRGLHPRKPRAHHSPAYQRSQKRTTAPTSSLATATLPSNRCWHCSRRRSTPSGPLWSTNMPVFEPLAKKSNAAWTTCGPR